MVYYSIGILFALLLILGIFRSLKFIIKMAVNIFLGFILLLIINSLCQAFGLSGIELNPISAFIAGFFGLPGVIFLAIFKIFL